jgi:hypothetical protein
MLLSFSTLSLASAGTTPSTTTPTTAPPVSSSPSILIVKMVVVGTPPPGATFTEAASCVPLSKPFGIPHTYTVLYRFDAAGKPIDYFGNPGPPGQHQDSRDDELGTDCRFLGASINHETDTRAPTRTIDCSLTYGPHDPEHLATCNFEGVAFPPYAQLLVHFPGSGSDVAVVTITNTFPDIPDPVNLSPTFTG